MLIREITVADWPEVWPIVRDVVQAQQTFAYDAGLNAEQAHGIWIEAPPGLTVAIAEGRVVRTAKWGPTSPLTSPSRNPPWTDCNLQRLRAVVA